MKKIIFTCLLAVIGYGLSYSQARLKFTHDNAGNQTRYSIDYTKPDPSPKSAEPFLEATPSEEEILSNKFSVSPNPTSGEVTLQWQEDIKEQITKIELVSILNGTSVPVIYKNKNIVSLNLTDKAPGLYMVIFHLNNPEVKSIQKKILKY